MEKHIEINGNQVLLRCSCYCQLVYKAAFGTNFVTDITRAEQLSKEIKEETDPIIKIDKSEDIKAIYLQIIWSMAKDGDESLLPFPEWLKSVEKIDVFGIIKEISEMLIKSVTPDRKNE